MPPSGRGWNFSNGRRAGTPPTTPSAEATRPRSPTRRSPGTNGLSRIRVCHAVTARADWRRCARRASGHPPLSQIVRYMEPNQLDALGAQVGGETAARVAEYVDGFSERARRTSSAVATASPCSPRASSGRASTPGWEMGPQSTSPGPSATAKSSTTRSRVLVLPDEIKRLGVGEAALITPTADPPAEIILVFAPGEGVRGHDVPQGAGIRAPALPGLSYLTARAKRARLPGLCPGSGFDCPRQCPVCPGNRQSPGNRVRDPLGASWLDGRFAGGDTRPRVRPPRPTLTRGHPGGQGGVTPYPPSRSASALLP